MVLDSSEQSITSYNTKLEQKDKIIEELKMQLNLRTDFSSGNDQVAMQQKDNYSLRDRKFTMNVSNILPVVSEPSQLEILTNTLLEKQALLEAMTAEKNILALKVEKLEVYLLVS